MNSLSDPNIIQVIMSSGAAFVPKPKQSQYTKKVYYVKHIHSITIGFKALHCCKITIGEGWKVIEPFLEGAGVQTHRREIFWTDFPNLCQRFFDQSRDGLSLWYPLIWNDIFELNK